MQTIVICSKEQKDELIVNGMDQHANVLWLNEIGHLEDHKNATAVIDLLFENDQHRINILYSMGEATVIINCVEHALAELNSSFIRINAWPGFIQAKELEASANSTVQREKATAILSLFNKVPVWLPDEPGFVSARIISMIINEAFLALEEGVSSREEMDTAMKLGTNYPYGPFEWAEKIGRERIYRLLKNLSSQKSSYRPAPLLTKAS